LGDKTARPIGPKPKGPRRGCTSRRGGGEPPPHQLEGLGECCKLTQWDLGQSPNRKRFWRISNLVEDISWKHFLSQERCWCDKMTIYCSQSLHICVIDFSLKFPGCSNTQNTPSYDLARGAVFQLWVQYFKDGV